MAAKWVLPEGRKPLDDAWFAERAQMQERIKAAQDDAKAVVALSEAIYLLDPDEEDIAKETGLYRIVTTFKELKGQDDD